MATRIKDIRQRRFYPWGEWCDGSAWEVTKGEDFDLSPAAFRSRLYEVASRRGMKVSSRLVGEDRVWFQFRMDNHA